MAPKRVALLIETSSSWGSQIIAGISDYVRRHERWVVYVDHRGVYEQQTVPSFWENDGIIARVLSPLLAGRVQADRLPCVNVSQIRVPSTAIQQVTTNEQAVGALAGKTLLAAGLQHFAYYGPPPREHYVDGVASAYFKVIQSAGFNLAAMNPADAKRSTASRMDLSHIAQWLQSLPKPVGILTWNSLGAHRLIEACCCAGITVPELVSVLSGDHDHLVAEISTPRLTCIDHSPRRVGYLAAAELDRLMARNDVQPPVLVEPEGVVWRESVLNAAAQDELVAEALVFIRAKASEGIQVEDVLQVVAASRRSLETRFRKAIGRGPAAELRRVRLERARQLLSDTEIPVKQIALRCGFSGAEQLQRVLRAETSLTPTQYREVCGRPRTAQQSPRPELTALYEKTQLRLAVNAPARTVASAAYPA